MDERNLDDIFESAGAGASGDPEQDVAAGISNLPENAPETAYDNKLPDFPDDARPDPPPALKSGAGPRICTAACAVFGVAGAAAIAACTFAVAGLYGSDFGPGSVFAAGFPNGAVIGDVSQGTDAAGNPSYDIGISYPGSSAQTPDVSDRGESGNGADRNDGDPAETPAAHTSTAAAAATEPEITTSTAITTTAAPASGDGQDSGDSAGEGAQGAPASTPSTAMPDMGEPSERRATELMESEYLRAQARRLADGGERYLPSDIRIEADGRALSEIAAEYGFTEGFLKAYNGIEGNACPPFLAVPAA